MGLNPPVSRLGLVIYVIGTAVALVVALVKVGIEVYSNTSSQNQQQSTSGSYTSSQNPQQSTSGSYTSSQNPQQSTGDSYTSSQNQQQSTSDSNTSSQNQQQSDDEPECICRPITLQVLFLNARSINPNNRSAPFKEKI